MFSHFFRCGDSYLEVRAEGQTEDEDQLKADSYITLSQSRPKLQSLDSSAVQDEIRTLKIQLRMAEELAVKVQLEVSGLAPVASCSLVFSRFLEMFAIFGISWLLFIRWLNSVVSYGVINTSLPLLSDEHQVWMFPVSV